MPVLSSVSFQSCEIQGMQCGTALREKQLGGPAVRTLKAICYGGTDIGPRFGSMATSSLREDGG